MTADGGGGDASVNNEAQLSVANGPLVAPVLSRVVAMIAARAQLPINRLDDCLLLADAVAAHGQAFTHDGHTCVLIGVDAGGMEFSVGPLRVSGAEGLLRAADLPGVGNVLERVADEVELRTGDKDGEHLVLKLAAPA